MTDIYKAAQQALEAWDETVLPVANDGMMQERMEELRAALAQPADHIPDARKMMPAEPVPHCEAGPEYCWQCLEEINPTYGSEEIRKLRDVIANLSPKPAAWVELSDEDKAVIEVMRELHQQQQADTALLRQALDALNHVNVQDRVQTIAALRQRLGDTK